METSLTALGEEVQDAHEETFYQFFQAAALPDLGMLDPKAATLELSIRGKDFTITQSPGLLLSSRDEGTTGAAVWQTSVRVAWWLSDAKNALFTDGLLSSESMVLELGSGVSGLVPSILASKVGSVVATDQQHLLKSLRSNIEANSPPSLKEAHRVRKARQPAQDIKVLALDWEKDDVPKQLTSNGLCHGVDLVLACDCVYNYALIEPFVQACADIARLRTTASGSEGFKPTFCLIAQQLRQREVFEEWLETFMRSFRVWRVHKRLLPKSLGEESGFAVHIGILR